VSGERVALVRLDQVDFHPHNIRRDLGDLRALAASLASYGLQSPIAVERWGDRLRLRAGHRRVAAARIAGLARLTAVIYDEPLEDDQWLAASVQENVHRQGIDAEERRRTVLALREHGFTWQGIADVFGVTHPAAPQKWARDPAELAASRSETRTRIRRTQTTYVADIADRWADAAPAALIEELRHLATTGRLPEQAP